MSRKTFNISSISSKGHHFIKHHCYYRKPWHLTMWPWTSRGRSGSSWPLLRRTCTGTWCWKTIATCCLWVRTAPLGPWEGPQWVAFPFSASESSGVSMMLWSNRFLAPYPDTWVCSPFSWEKSLYFVSCNIVLSSNVTLCCLHRSQAQFSGSKSVVISHE